MNALNKDQISQAIRYLEWKAGQQLPLKALFSLIYLADRYHLRKHGSLIVGGNTIPQPEGYAIVDESLPPINLEVAYQLGLHPENRETFLIEIDLAQ